MDKLFQDLILAYDRQAETRDTQPVSEWTKDLCLKILDRLKSKMKSTLIDIGAGPGIHAKFFSDQGIQVTCIDLSPAHIRKCTEKGLESYLLNVLDLDSLDRAYDCAFALNSLLHLPSDRLPSALSKISGILQPDGLFYWGQYGGEYREGIYKDDHHQPKRFFTLLDDQQIIEYASRYFVVEEFDVITLEADSPLHFQSALTRVKSQSD
jgi:cyclopropane fatty-acyl-phospholipid synthase-like methyltransferase